jgi:hypothetical protein
VVRSHSINCSMNTKDSRFEELMQFPCEILREDCNDGQGKQVFNAHVFTANHTNVFPALFPDILAVLFQIF